MLHFSLLLCFVLRWRLVLGYVVIQEPSAVNTYDANGNMTFSVTDNDNTPSITDLRPFLLVLCTRSNSDIVRLSTSPIHLLDPEIDAVLQVELISVNPNMDFRNFTTLTTQAESFSLPLNWLQSAGLDAENQ